MKDHRNVQRYIVPVIAGAVSPEFVMAIRALLDFRYFAQSGVISEEICLKIEHSLQLFHESKEAIQEAEARRGKNGPIEHWCIPKLEFLQSVVFNIRCNGVACQWSAEVSENAHIGVVKDPARSGNNKDYEPQICRHLDRVDKLQSFELATAIRTSGIEFGLPHPASQIGNNDKDSDDLDNEVGVDTSESDTFVTSTSELLSCLATSGYNSGSPRRTTDYFHRAKLLDKDLLGVSELVPARTYQCAKNIVYHLSRDPCRFKLPTQAVDDPSRSKLPIDDVATIFNIPDLRPAIADFIKNVCKGSHGANGYIQDVGKRRMAQKNAQLHVTHLEVWKKLRLQTTAYHYPHNILPPSTINAAPPSPEFPHGHFDPAIVNVDQNQKWPTSGISGK